MNEKLIEAKKILEEKKLLLKKYPDKFSLQLDVKQWSGIVDKLEKGESNQEIKEEVNRILKNAIGDILLYGCSSLPCEECPLFNCVEDSSNEKLCEAIGEL